MNKDLHLIMTDLNTAHKKDDRSRLYWIVVDDFVTTAKTMKTRLIRDLYCSEQETWRRRLKELNIIHCWKKPLRDCVY